MARSCLALGCMGIACPAEWREAGRKDQSLQSPSLWSKGLKVACRENTLDGNAFLMPGFHWRCLEPS